MVTFALEEKVKEKIFTVKAGSEQPRGGRTDHQQTVLSITSGVKARLHAVQNIHTQYDTNAKQVSAPPFLINGLIIHFPHF